SCVASDLLSGRPSSAYFRIALAPSDIVDAGTRYEGPIAAMQPHLPSPIEPGLRRRLGAIRARDNATLSTQPNFDQASASNRRRRTGQYSIAVERHKPNVIYKIRGLRQCPPRSQTREFPDIPGPFSYESPAMSGRQADGHTQAREAYFLELATHVAE